MYVGVRSLDKFKVATNSGRKGSGKAPINPNQTQSDPILPSDPIFQSCQCTEDQKVNAWPEIWQFLSFYEKGYADYPITKIHLSGLNQCALFKYWLKKVT